MSADEQVAQPVADVETAAPAPEADAPAPAAAENAVAASGKHVSLDGPVEVIECYEEPADVEEEENLFERLHEEGVAKREERLLKAQQARLERAEKEAAGFTFKPTIVPPVSRRPVDDFIFDLNEKKTRHEKVMQRATEKVLNDEKEKCEGVAMSKGSEKLVKRMQQDERYAGVVSGWRSQFCHHLMNRTRSPDAIQGTPRINKGKHADSPPKYDPRVFDKLYEDSLMRQSAAEMIKQAENEHASRNMFRPETLKTMNAAKYLHAALSRSPSANRSVSTLSQYTSDGTPRPEAASETQSVAASDSVREDVVEYLLRKGEEYKQHKAAIRDANTEHYDFKPKTNKHSQRIVQGWGKTPPQARRPVPTPDASNKDRVLAVANLVGKMPPKFDVEVFASRMERQKAIKEAKLAMLQREKEMKEYGECSFRPMLAVGSPSRTSEFRSPVSAGQTHHHHHPAASVASRSPANTPRTQRGPAVRTTPRGTQQSHRQHAARKPYSPAPTIPIASGSTTAANSPNRAGDADHRATVRMDPARPSVDPNEKGIEYLSALESELRNVIEDWQTVEQS